MSVEQAQAGPTHTADQRSVWIVFSGLMLALLIASLDQTVVATALPTIVSDLGGLSQLSWVVTGYLLASMVSTPLWGKLGDLYERKRLFWKRSSGHCMCWRAPRAGITSTSVSQHDLESLSN